MLPSVCRKQSIVDCQTSPSPLHHSLPLPSPTPSPFPPCELLRLCPNLRCFSVLTFSCGRFRIDSLNCRFSLPTVDGPTLRGPRRAEAGRGGPVEQVAAFCLISAYLVDTISLMDYFARRDQVIYSRPITNNGRDN